MAVGAGWLRVTEEIACSMSKHCPTCQRVYTDESLRFCLDDGAFLVGPTTAADDPQRTLRFDEPRNTAAMPGQFPGSSVTLPTARKKSALPWILAGVAMLLLVSLGIGIAILIALNDKSGTSSSGGSNSNQSNFNLPTITPTLAPTPTPTPETIFLAGTSWAGTDSTGDYRRFTFTPNGLLNNNSTDTWRQAGNQVYWEINNAYSHYDGTITGDRIDYTAYNKVDKHWTGTLARVTGAPSPSPTPNTNTTEDFKGVSIRIVHIAQRADDARTAAARLRGLGADVTVFETGDSGNGSWVGTIVYWEGQEELARRIASSVADIEIVTPKFAADKESKRTFYLWIAKKK